MPCSSSASRLARRSAVWASSPPTALGSADGTPVFGCRSPPLRAGASSGAGPGCRTWVLIVDVFLAQLGHSEWVNPLSPGPPPESLGKLPSSPPQADPLL